jgi:hypothetical protein
VEEALAFFRHDNDPNGHSKQVSDELPLQLRVSPAAVSLNVMQALVLTILEYCLQ